LEKTLECPLCGRKHIIDKYEWVDTCIGYIPLAVLDKAVEEYSSSRKISISTKNNTRSR